jgi:Leucine-rich repeat (LRR) protein
MGNELGTLKKYKKEEVVDLSNQKLGSLPSQIGKLKACKRLNLSKNDLAELIPEVGMSKARRRAT